MKDLIGKIAARALAAILFASTTFLIGCVQVWRFPASPTTMILNWTLTSNRGDVVWAETVKGESTTKMGFNAKKSAKQQSEEAAQMLFRDSYAKLLSSRQIRDFAAKQ